PACLGPFSLLGAVGPMTRTIADLRLMYQIMSGPDDGDVMSAPVAVDTVPERPLRVGYMEEHPSAPVTPETRAAVRTAAQRLRQQGHDVFPFTLSRLEEVREVWWTFFVRCGERLLRDMYKGR